MLAAHRGVRAVDRADRQPDRGLADQPGRHHRRQRVLGRFRGRARPGSPPTADRPARHRRGAVPRRRGGGAGPLGRGARQSGHRGGLARAHGGRLRRAAARRSPDHAGRLRPGRGRPPGRRVPRRIHRARRGSPVLRKGCDMAELTAAIVGSGNIGTDLHAQAAALGADRAALDGRHRPGQPRPAARRRAGTRGPAPTASTGCWPRTRCRTWSSRPPRRPCTAPTRRATPRPASAPST